MSVHTETIHIEGLPPGTKNALEELGRGNGKSAEEYARMIIEAEVLSRKSFDEIVEPIRQSFDESGMTDEELSRLIEDAREEVYQAGLSKNR